MADNDDRRKNKVTVYPMSLKELDELAERAFRPAIERSKQTRARVHEQLRQGWDEKMARASTIQDGRWCVYHVIRALADNDTQAEAAARANLETVLTDNPELEPVLLAELPHLHWRAVGQHVGVAPGEDGYPAPPPWRVIRWGE